MENWLCIFCFLMPIVAVTQCLEGDCADGKGVFRFSNGATYKGEFRKSVPHGEGVFIYSNGNQYLGDWVLGKKSGQGKIYFTNGASFEGAFLDNFMDGYGVYTFKDKSYYEGYFSGDRPNGQGTLYKTDGEVVSGLWADGKLQSKPLNSNSSLSSGALQSLPNAGDVTIYAVIVGVSRYENFETLKYSDDDAYRIYAFLKSPEGGAVPDRNIHILIDESAVKENIMHAMKSVSEMADENDVIICYFAGHGLEGYFLPVDSDGYRRRASYFSLKELLAKSKAKQKLFMADACYSGSLLASRNPNLSNMQKFYDRLNSTAGGTAFLLSSKQSEYSKEASGLRQGVFSYFLIEGMKGAADMDDNSIVTIEELYQFIRDGVRTYTKNEQNPLLAGQYQSDLPVSWVRK